MKYIFWDIDGTLLTTGFAGTTALKLAVKERFNVDDYTFSFSLPGCTDSAIVKQICLDLKKSCSLSDVASLLILYHRFLPQALEQCHGKLLSNIPETLEYIEQHPDKYMNCLLTGNTVNGAFQKLRHYGIDRYFEGKPAACGELNENRSELARIALRRLQQKDPSVTPDDIIVIGDTVNDIACAHAIDARCIVVTEAGFTHIDELKAANPWHILPQFPENPEEFAAILDGKQE